MAGKQQGESTGAAFAPLKDSGVALLTTFRRNGQGVGTPVGIRLAGGRAYFTTWTTTGKVKRLAGNPRVTLAPCTRRGQVTGPVIAGVARRLEGSEAERIAARLFTKSLLGRLWLLFYRLRGWEPVLYEVSPDRAGEAARAA